MQLKNLSKLHKLALEEIFEDLKEEPLLGKKLSRDLTNRFSYRVGVFRIIYLVNEKDQTVTILTSNHRERVYN